MRPPASNLSLASKTQFPRGLRARDQVLARNMDIISTNLAALNDFFARHTDLFQWTPPTAGPIAFPKLLVGSVEEMVWIARTRVPVSYLQSKFVILDMHPGGSLICVFVS